MTVGEENPYFAIMDSKFDYTFEQFCECGASHRDNNQRRLYLRHLILNTRFYKPGSQLSLFSGNVVGNVRKAKRITCFLHGKYRTFVVDDSDQRVQQRLQLYVKQNDSHKELTLVRQAARKLKALDFEAQALFGVDLNLKLQDETLSLLFSRITQLLSSTGVKEALLYQVLEIVSKIILAFKIDLTDTVARTALVFTLCNSLGCAKMVIDKAISFFSNIVSPREFRTQGPDFSTLYDFLCGFLSLFFFKDIPSLDLMKKIKAVGDISRSLVSVTALVEKLMKYAFPALYQWYTGYPYEIDQLSEFFSDIKKWYSDVQALVDIQTFDEIALSEEKCREVEYLYRKGLFMVARCSELKVPPACMQALNLHFGVVKMTYDKVMCSGAFKGGPRSEPLVIALYGESGVGKSGMMYPLSIELLKLDGLIDGRWAEEIYARNVEQEYWDGYKGQRVVLYDDFGQMKDSVSKPNLEYFELIRTGNLAPYPVHMANLHEKANSFFTSKIVLLSSNTKWFAPESLSHPEAVRRRIDVFVEVFVKKEFRKNVEGKEWMLDPAKVMKKCGKVLSTDVYEFKFIDPMTGHQSDFSKKPFSYNELVEHCAVLYQNKFHRSNKVMNILNDLARKEFMAQGPDLKYSYEHVMQVYFDERLQQALPLETKLYIQTHSLKEFYNAYLLDEIEISFKIDVIQSIAEEPEYEGTVATLFRKAKEVKRNIPAYITAFQQKLAEVKCSLMDFLSKAKEEMLKHPLITATCAILPLVLYFCWNRDDPEEEYSTVELTCSGDPKTARKVRFTEMAASGDPKTQKSIRRVEVAASGDPKVSKPVRKVEMAASADPKTVRPVRKVEMAASADPKTKKEPFKVELQEDANAFNLSQKLVMNMYKIEMFNGLKSLGSVRGLFIKGTVFLTVRHIRFLLEQSTHFTLTNAENPTGYKIPISAAKMFDVTGADGELKDQMLIQCPLTVRQHANVMGNFSSSIEMSKFIYAKACMLTPAKTTCLLRYGEIEAVDQPWTYKGDVTYHIRRHYKYGMETTNGDCGSPLIVIGTQYARKILGIHVAGTTGVGMASPVCVEDLNRILKSVPEVCQIEMDCEEWFAHNAFQEQGDQIVSKLKLPEGNFTSIGQPQYKIVGSSKTQIRPSLIHGEVTENVTIPCVLGRVKVGDKIIDPMMEGLKKCAETSTVLNKDYLQACVNDVRMNFPDDPQRQRILTDDEMVRGVEGDEFMVAISRSTSPGYPFRKDAKGPGKTDWLGKDEDFYLREDLAILIRERIEAAKRNERFPTIWTDTLKDERRPIIKVINGKTRVFSAGPMDYCLTFRKYFLGFAGHCAHNRNRNEISVGTNVYSQDWDIIANILSTHGEKVIAGDFSNFDGTLNAEILWSICDIINDWYDDGEENKRIRRVLWAEIVNSVHVCGDAIYHWTHSQPSGNPLTAILNSVYNSIACRYVWMLLTESRPQDHSMRSFRENVSMVAYGDDNVLNISDYAIGFYNQVSMSQAFSTFGMTYTDESKSGEMLPYRSIFEVGYLKRAFVYNKDLMKWEAPLALESVLEIPNWTRKTMDNREATTLNIEVACAELSLHDQETFEYWTQKFRRAALKHKLRPLILTYQEYKTSEMVKYGAITAKTD
nr:hypothetical protein 1 [Beihai picorna-like virus 74]